MRRNAMINLYVYGEINERVMFIRRIFSRIEKLLNGIEVTNKITAEFYRFDEFKKYLEESNKKFNERSVVNGITNILNVVIENGGIDIVIDNGKITLEVDHRYREEDLLFMESVKGSNLYRLIDNSNIIGLLIDIYNFCEVTDSKLIIGDIIHVSRPTKRFRIMKSMEASLALISALSRITKLYSTGKAIVLK